MGHPCAWNKSELGKTLNMTEQVSLLYLYASSVQTHFEDLVYGIITLFKNRAGTCCKKRKQTANFFTVERHLRHYA